MKLRVAYAKNRYKDKLYVTPLIVTSYRDEQGVARNKTIQSLAGLPAPLVSLIDRALKEDNLDELNNYANLRDLRTETARPIGAEHVAFCVLEQLGIRELIEANMHERQAVAVLSLIVNRMVAPKPESIMMLQRQYPSSAIAHLLNSPESPALSTWYAALPQLEAVRETIQGELFKRHNSNSTLFLYDITSSYFEGETCPLADYGYNRDGKKGKKQIVIGLVCDHQGCPVWVDVFKGNTADQSTVKQQMINLKEKLGVKEFVFVGDRGMVTRARIEELEKDGWWNSFKYITALTRKEMMNLIDDERHPMQINLFDHMHLSEVEENGERYVLCHNPLRKHEDHATRVRLLDKTEARLKALAVLVAKGRLKRKELIQSRADRWLQHWGMKKMFNIKVGEATFYYERNAEIIATYEGLDGCYVIRSNVEKDRLRTRELLEKYKNLQYVEQAFRTMKSSDIQIRPVRHFGEDHVRGHVFACFLAYRGIWELRQRFAEELKRDDHRRCEAGSLQDIWKELSRIAIVQIKAKDKTWFKLTDLTERQSHLLKLAKVADIRSSSR